jgi:hypothetical protein
VENLAVVYESLTSCVSGGLRQQEGRQLSAVAVQQSERETSRRVRAGPMRAKTAAETVADVHRCSLSFAAAAAGNHCRWYQTCCIGFFDLPPHYLSLTSSSSSLIFAAHSVFSSSAQPGSFSLPPLLLCQLACLLSSRVAMRVSSSLLLSVLVALCCLSSLPSVHSAFWHVYGDASCPVAQEGTDPYLDRAINSPPYDGTCTVQTTVGSGNSFTFVYKSASNLTTVSYTLYNGTLCDATLVFATVKVLAAAPDITCESSTATMNGTTETFYSTIGFGVSSSSSGAVSSSSSSSSSAGGSTGNTSQSSSSGTWTAPAGNYSSSSGGGMPPGRDSSSSSSSGAGGDDDGMSTTMLAVIGAAIVVAIVVTIIGAYYGYRAYKQRQQRQRQPDEQQGTGSYGALTD